MNLSKGSSVFSTSSASSYSNDGRSTSMGDSGSGRRLSYFNWDGFEPDPNFWNIDDDDDVVANPRTTIASTKSSSSSSSSSSQAKPYQSTIKQAVLMPKSTTPKKTTTTPQTQKTGQSPSTKSPQSAQKKVTKRPPTSEATTTMSSIEAARMSASPLASKKPRTSILSPQAKAKSSIASPKVKTPNKTVTFATALTETYEDSGAKKGVSPRAKVSSSPSPSKPALKKTATPTKISQAACGSKDSTPVTSAKTVTNAEMVRMIQEQNAKIDKLARELEREKAARIALEKRLKIF